MIIVVVIIRYQHFRNWKSNYNIGIATDYFLRKNISLGGGIVYNLINNPNYYFGKEDPLHVEFAHNFSFSVTVQYRF
jgi:hypothetical protein